MKAILHLSLLLLSAGCVSGDFLKAPGGPLNGVRIAPKAQPTGAVFTAVTQPGYVSEVPRGPTTVRYGFRCYGNYFCIGEKDIGSVSLSSPVVAVASVDFKTLNYQVYSINEIIVNGWSRDAWEKKYGSLDAIPGTARLFATNVELNDGRILTNVMTQQDERYLFAQDSSGRFFIEDRAQVKRVSAEGNP